MSDNFESLLSTARIQEKTILALRDEFFNSLIEEWSRPPQEIDRLMGQEDCFYLPDFKKPDLATDPKTVMIKDVERGVLAISVTPEKPHPNSGNIRWVYSIMQAGDWLRYGLLIQGDPRQVIKYERHHEHVLAIEQIWDRPCDHQFRDSAGLLLEWRFTEPDFYKDFMYRERFKIIARHLHFRLGRIMQPLFEDADFVEEKRSRGSLGVEEEFEFRHEKFGE